MVAPQGWVRVRAVSTPSAEEESSLFCGPDGQVMDRPGGVSLVSESASKLYHIHTMGCQMNLADSERMAGALEAEGYVCTPDIDMASVVVYNTCSIRDKAEQKVYSAVGRIAAKKRKSMGDTRIVVAGCVAQQEGEALLRRIPELDLVIGPQHAPSIGHLLAQVETTDAQLCATEEIDGPVAEDVTAPKRDSSVSAWVNVIYGCNESCTYCIVPSVRGSEKSRDADAVLREVIACAEAGYQEVTLLGQNIDAYGRDLPGVADDGSGRRLWTFSDLLRKVASDPLCPPRVRFATSHPRYFTRRLVDTIAELPRVCRYFHIPFQSGDDEVLRRMARGYTAQRYEDILAYVREKMPDCSITADAFVGFPGETEEQFERTCDLVRRCKLDSVNTAAYSPRPGTPAAVWDDQVADLIKQDRLQRLNAVVAEVAEEASQRWLGTEQWLLFEGVDAKDACIAWGRTDGNRKTWVRCASEAEAEGLVGKFGRVTITEARAFSLSGDLLEVVSEPDRL